MTKKCKCKYRIRGANHNNGDHHKKWWNTLNKDEKLIEKDLAPKD